MSAAREEESGALLSQEQKLKRSQAEENVVVTKGKMYTLVAIILVLFGILVSSQLGDWGTYEEQVGSEREVVILDGVVEKQVEVGAAINAEAAVENKELRELEKEDESAREEELAQELEKIEALAKEKELAEKKDRKKKRKKKRQKAMEKNFASRVDISAALSENDVKKKAARKNRHSEKTKQYDEMQKMMRAHFERKWKKMKKMTPRDFVLPAAKQKIVDEYDGSLKPPEYCYKSPKGNKAEPREPDKDDKRNADLPLDIAKKILRLAAADYPCLILHQECMRNETSQHADKFFHEYDRLYFQKSTLTREQKITKVPNFANLKLGTCAIVGNADNMLHHKHGKEIDEHDFVVRFNVITKPYKDGVGSKCSGLFLKPKYATSKFKRDLDPSMFNFFPKYVPFELKPATLPGGKPPLVYGQYDNGLWRTDLEQMFWGFIEEKNLTDAGYSFGVKKLPHPTGGLSRLRSMIQLLSMGVCDRLDVYGFSVGGGKYFDPKKIVSHAHPISSENYFYRLYMATGVHGKFCLYGK